MPVICGWCSQPVKAGQATEEDHVIPRVRGGPDQPWNMQTLHARCNSWKGDKLTAAAIRLAKERKVTLILPRKEAERAGTPFDEHPKAHPLPWLYQDPRFGAILRTGPEPDWHIRQRWGIT